MSLNHVAARAAFQIGVAAIALTVAAAANADPVSSTLSAQYFKVLDGTDPDFNLYSTPNVAANSLLGPNGMPLATGGVNDIVGGELTWWNPAANANVIATGTGTITLPYASNMYFPNSTGNNDSTAFETAIFTGTFSLASSGTVEFLLGSDDDTFIYVDGVLFGQNPGVHGVTNVDFTSPTLGAGSHNLEIFYADRENTGAYMSLSLVSKDVVITAPGVPEPASWAMMVAGLGIVGATMRRRSVRVQFA